MGFSGVSININRKNKMDKLVSEKTSADKLNQINTDTTNQAVETMNLTPPEADKSNIISVSSQITDNTIPSVNYGKEIVTEVDLSEIMKQPDRSSLFDTSKALPQEPLYYSELGYQGAVRDQENFYQQNIDKLMVTKQDYEAKVSLLTDYELLFDNYDRYQLNYNEAVISWINNFKYTPNSANAKTAMERFGWTADDLQKSNAELIAIAKQNDSVYIDDMKLFMAELAPLQEQGLISDAMLNSGEMRYLLDEYKYYLSLTEAELKTQRYNQQTAKYDLILETQAFQDIKDTLPLEPINPPTYATKETLLFMNNYNPKYVQIYNYLYQTGGWEAAYPYISDITDEINQFRGMQQANDRIDKLILANEEDIKLIESELASLNTTDSDAVKQFLSLVSSKVDDSSVQSLIDSFDYNDTANIDNNLIAIVEQVNGVSRLKTMSLTNFALTAGTGLGDGLYDFGEGFAKIFADGEITVQDYEEMYYANYLAEHSNYYDDIYGVGQGVGNMLPTTVTGAILYATAPEIAPFVTGTMIAASSFGTTKNDMLYQGYSAEKAMLYAALTASSDALLEVAFGGIEGVGVTAKSAFGSAEKVTFRNLALHQLREMAQEGGEEVIQDLFKTGVIDTLVLGKPVDFGELTEQSAKTFFQSAMVAGILNAGSTPISITINGVQRSFTQAEIENLSNSVNNGLSYQAALENAITEQQNAGIKGHEDFYNFAKEHPGMSGEALNALYQEYKNNPNFNSTINTNIDNNTNNNTSTVADFENNDFYNFAMEHPGIPTAELNALYNASRNPTSINPGSFIDKVLDTVNPNRRVNISNIANIDGNHSIYNFFDSVASMTDSKYGVDQAAIQKLSIYTYNGKEYSYYEIMDFVNDCIQNNEVIPKIQKEAPQEYFDLKDSLIERGFSSGDASVILSSINDAGACSYAAVCNDIFYLFRDQQEYFESVFGYPMYKRNPNGAVVLNSTDLLLDLYLYSNDVKNGGNLIKNNQLLVKSSKVDVFGRAMLDSSEQAYMSNIDEFNTKLVNGFLKSKDSKLSFEADAIVQNRDGDVMSEQEFRNTVVAGVYEALSDGKALYMDYYYDPNSDSNIINMESFYPDLYRSVSTATWNEGSGHAVSITGVAEDGFVISSWGRKYVIPFEDLYNGGVYNIYGTQAIYRR